jgi:hypothetical protein
MLPIFVLHDYHNNSIVDVQFVQMMKCIILSQFFSSKSNPCKALQTQVNLENAFSTTTLAMGTHP